MEKLVIPKLIATSVVRGSQKGQSHGGVFTVDFSTQSVQQHVDWNNSDIDFTGRGWDRGLRGIEFTESEVVIAASDELFFFDSDFSQKESYSNRYLKHCHEISRRDNLLFITSTGYDSLLAFDLVSRSFAWGIYISRDGQQWVGQTFDPRNAGGPPPSNNYHINMVHVNQHGIYVSGLRSKAMLKIDSKMNVTEVCNLPEGTHNAQPFNEGLLVNDTQSDAVRFVSREGEQCAFGVLSYPESDVDFLGIDDSKIARQAFARGLCPISDRLVAGGSSPSTICVYDLQEKQRIATVNLSMDVRNAIHGLEVWPWG